MKHPFSLSILSLAICSLSTGGLAQADGSDDLEEVKVYGSVYRTTGTKSDLSPMEAPMSFEIYDNELLELRQADTINEALRYVPGITPESRATATIFDQYNIRGFDSYNNYYDGLPLQYNQLWNLMPQVDAFATESVEVLKGPTSVLYGSAPPGGMVNQTAKQPQSEQSTRIRMRAGTNSLAELGVDTTGALTENVDYRLIALGRSRDAQQETTEEERRTIAPSVTWQIGDRTSLNLNAYYQDDPKAIPSTTLPAIGTLYAAPYGKLDSDAYAGDENWNSYSREFALLGYKFSHAFSDSVTFLQNLRYTDASALQRNTYSAGLAEDGRTYARNAYYTDEAQEGLAMDNQLAIDLNAGGAEHRLLLGLDYQDLDSTIGYGDTFGIDTPTIDLGAPDYNQFDPDTLPVDYYTEQHKIQQEQLGLYLQDEIHWGKLVVILGTRWDDYQSEDVANTTYETGVTEIDQDQFSSRAAAIYSFDSGLSPYASYSESFEPTSGIDSLTGEAFEPTTAEQWEAGLKYSAPASDLELTAAAFDLRKQNVVVNTADFFQYTQNGEVTSRGIELAATWSPVPDLALTTNYNYQDVEITENALDPSLEGKTPEWVADEQASVWANYNLTDALMFGGGVRYVGNSPVDKANSDQVPSYTLVDLVMSYTLSERYELGLSASNLTDKRYIGACAGVSRCWMGAQRSVEFTVNVQL